MAVKKRGQMIFTIFLFRESKVVKDGLKKVGEKNVP